MSQAVGSAFALAAFIGVCALLCESSGSHSLSKDLSKAQGKLNATIGEAQDVVAETKSSVKHAGSDLVHMRMTSTTIAILTLIAAFVAYRFLWHNARRRPKHE